MRVRLRPARPGDLTALCRLERACFGADAWGELALREELADPAPPVMRRVLVAENGEHLIGYGSVGAVEDTADVRRLAVARAHRRVGVGRRLLGGLLDAASSAGCVDTLLEVRADNTAALELYRRHGFAPLGRRPGYYDGSRVDALVLRLVSGR